jgi:hypothetical protein
MSQNEITELKEMLSAHANVVRLNAKLHRMLLANENARFKGKADVYNEDSFKEIEQELEHYAKELTDGE